MTCSALLNQILISLVFKSLLHYSLPYCSEVHSTQLRKVLGFFEEEVERDEEEKDIPCIFLEAQMDEECIWTVVREEEEG